MTQVGRLTTELAIAKLTALRLADFVSVTQIGGDRRQMHWV